jgi:hypothetical protein
MRSLASLSCAAVSVIFFALGAHATAAAAGYHISGPFTHENLSLYFVHGEADKRPVPLTLEEALAKGAVRVDETGNVNELAIENLADEPVFIQAGDIVKGGKQDRVIGVSLLVPAKSGRFPLASFCVEHGRWSARGVEAAGRFSSSVASLSSRTGKMALYAPPLPPSGLAADPSRAADIGKRQQAMWTDVARTQRKLEETVGAPVVAGASPSSLQLSLENEKLAEAKAPYLKALSGVAKDDDIVGYVFAINGKINSGDVYPSSGLFRKMWSKLLNSSVVEAVAEKKGIAGTAPSTDEVLAFLSEAEKSPASVREVNNVSIKTGETSRALYNEAMQPSGGFAHRSYILKGE